MHKEVANLNDGIRLRLNEICDQRREAARSNEQVPRIPIESILNQARKHNVCE
jgi:hypothetical protein